jgi:hypothetical protein
MQKRSCYLLLKRLWPACIHHKWTNLKWQACLHISEVCVNIEYFKPCRAPEYLWAKHIFVIKHEKDARDIRIGKWFLGLETVGWLSIQRSFDEDSRELPGLMRSCSQSTFSWRLPGDANKCSGSSWWVRVGPSVSTYPSYVPLLAIASRSSGHANSLVTPSNFPIMSY